MNGKALEEGLTNCLPMARGYRDRASASMALSLAPLEDSGGPRMTSGMTTRHVTPSDADNYYLDLPSNAVTQTDTCRSSRRN